MQMLGRIGIHRKMKRAAAHLAGHCIDQNVLHPHAGVVEFSLVPRRDQRLVDVGVPNPLAKPPPAVRAAARFE